MPDDETKSLARRQVLGAGIAGATLLLVPDACSSGGGGPADASTDISTDVIKRMDVGSSCPPADYSRSINIARAGIANQGTSYEFSDPCYKDPHCGQDRILLIHPVTKDVYVAMSGSCTHECCDNTLGEGGPTYYATLEHDAGGIAEAGTPEGASAEGGTSEGGALDAATDAGTVLQDVLVCSCHGSMFSALDGSVLAGPAADPLQLLMTHETGGNVVVVIPKA